MLALCGMVPLTAATAVTRDFTIRHWSVDDGLPQNRISALAQTSDGYLWVGTWFGLVRFDGAHFTTFNRYNTPALLNDVVNALAVGPDGALWIATRNGLLRFHEAEWKRFTTGDGLADNGIWDLAFDGRGVLWVSCGNGRVGPFPGGPFAEFSWPGGLLAPGGRLLPLSSGNMSFLGPRELLLMPAGMPVFPSPVEMRPGDYDQAIENDGQGGCWLGTWAGLWHVNAAGEWTPPGTKGWGVEIPDHLCRDRSGTLWANLRSRGLHRFNGFAFELVTLLPGQEQPGVAAFLNDAEGNLWLGTDAGLFQLRPRIIQAFTRAEGLLSDEIWSVSEGPDRSVWLGTARGLVRINSEGVKAIVDSICIATRSVLADDKGSVWMDWQTDLKTKGLGKYPPGLLEDFRVVGGDVEALYRDRQKRLWIGTDRGVHCFRDGKEVDVSKLPQVDVRFILQTLDGSMWFGSRHNGLFRWREGSLRQFTK